MQKWEYMRLKVILIRGEWVIKSDTTGGSMYDAGTTNIKDMTKALEVAGEEGWEMCGVVSLVNTEDILLGIPDTEKGLYHYVFKRPVED